MKRTMHIGLRSVGRTTRREWHVTASAEAPVNSDGLRAAFDDVVACLGVIGTLWLWVGCHGTERAPLLRLTEGQCRAIATAERFVRENGYTGDAATVERSERFLGPFERTLPIDVVLKVRRNRLRPHAIGLHGQVVVFEFNPEWFRQWGVKQDVSLPATGAAVVVSADGSAWVAHGEFRLDTMQVTLPDAAAVRRACDPQGAK